MHNGLNILLIIKALGGWKIDIFVKIAYEKSGYHWSSRPVFFLL